MALKIKALRNARGLTQQQLADLAGMERSQLSKIEREVEPASTKRLDALARALGVSVPELFDVSDPVDSYLSALTVVLQELAHEDREAVISHALALKALRQARQDKP